MLTIHQYEANDFINRATGFSGGGDPLPQPFSIQNHSWVGNGLSSSQVDLISARFDYMLNENDMLGIVGVANAGTNLPQLMVQGYNSISVGRSDNEHTSGLTQFYGTGRVKPEIVATGSATSFSTPRIAAVAAMLREAAAGTNADGNEQIKAIILAGATKVEYDFWERTIDRPLDTDVGAGELNAYNSYKVLLAGETDGEPSLPKTPTGSTGWDHGTIVQGESLSYLIELTEPADHLSILLTWNIDVVDGNNGAFFAPQAALSNMDLFFTGNGINDVSISNNHNIEHIYVRDLPAGTYAITITTNRTDDFSLAWRAASENVAPVIGIEPTTGTNSSGTILGVRDDDQQFYEVQPAPISKENIFGAAVEFEVSSPVNMENAIEFDLQAAVNTPNVDQEISLFNFTNQEYVVFDQSAASTVDTDYQAYVNGELYDFVDPGSGTIRARVTWRQTGPVFQSPWTIRIDRAEFVVSN